MKTAEQQALENEWKRAQGIGRTLQRQRVVATLAGTGATFALMLVLEGFAFVVWGGWIPAVVAAFLVSLLPGIAIRKKLWPRGQFA